MMMQEVVDSDYLDGGLWDAGETEEILPALEPEDLEYLRGRGVLPLLGYEPAGAAPAPAGAFGMVDVRAVLDGAFGVGGWEIRIGDGKSGGVIDTPAAGFPAATATARDPNKPIPPHIRMEQGLPYAAPDDGRVLCIRCGKGRHSPEYEHCWTCKQRDDGVDVDSLVTCAYCEKRTHRVTYKSCWDCRDYAAGAGAAPGGRELPRAVGIDDIGDDYEY